MKDRRSPLMRSVLVLAAVVLLSSCGGEMSLPEYAEQVEGLITEMNATLDEMDAEITSSTSLEELQAYARDRMELRHALLEDLSSLEPPARVADLHREAIDAIQNLVSAEDALVEQVLAAESAEVAANVWDTPEGRAAREADARTILLCEAAQETFDRTQAGEEFDDVPWIPDDMKHVIRVALGCRIEDR